MLFMLVFPQLADAADKYFDIRLTAREVVYGDIQMHSLAVSLDKSGNFVISAERLLGLPVFQQGVQLDGELQLLELGNDIAEATGRVRYQGVESKWHIRSGEQESSLCLEADTRLLHRLTEFEAIQEPLSWVKKGRLETCARYLQTTAVQDQIDLSLALKGLAFDSPDGRYAAEALEIGLEAEWLLMEPPVIEAEVRVEAGEVLLDNLYVNFSAAPLTSMLRPHWRDGELSGVGISASDDGAMKLMAELSIAGSDAWALDIKRLELAFPAAYGRYIEPLAALWTLDGLAVSGSMVWEGSLGPDKFRSGDLEIVDLSVVDTQLNRFALTGLETRLRPGNYDVSSELSWRGLLLGKINLGAGSALLDSEPGAFALLEPLELHVLGGKMHLERLHYRLPGTLLEGQSVSRFEIEARLTELDMAQLTTALGWPQFSGSLSGEVPGAMLSDGVLSVDGEVRVDVFDGAVIIRDLEVERLFGVLPSLSANIDMVGLELTQLTETFEFGRIGGKIDGYVHDLRMLDWRPVAFNAWMGTPESQSKSKAISRQAVNHLTTIGGGGATTALTSPMLRMFNNFSYRRLGLGCRLQNNACEITGVSEDGNSVLLMEGAGIPRITVRAWNRRVDWPQMVANLATISSGESIQVGDTPEP